jgi:hypothetical protein
LVSGLTSRANPQRAVPVLPHLPDYQVVPRLFEPPRNFLTTIEDESNSNKTQLFSQQGFWTQGVKVPARIDHQDILDGYGVVEGALDEEFS